MSLTLLGLPAEFPADTKFVIVDTAAAAAEAQRILHSQTVLWPSVDYALAVLPLESLMPLNGMDVLLWPTNTHGCRQAMVVLANSMQRVTDRVRFIYVNGSDEDGYSAAAMQGWSATQLVEWSKSRVRPYERQAVPDPMEIIAESLPHPVAIYTLYEGEVPRETPADESINTAEEPEKDNYRRPMKWAELRGKTPPERQWLVNHWLTYGPTLLAGQGGIGKTLLAQTLATALALGRHYIDKIAEPQTVLFWACEDDHDELWRRQLAICSMFEASLDELEGRLIIEPRLGLSNSLLLPTFGAPTWTPLHGELKSQVNDYKASVLMVDNIGQCFGGNENDRHHVTSFLSGLVGLSESPLAVIMLGHPAKSLNSEYSGSTAWEAAVRMRWYLGSKLPDQKPEEEDEADTNIRYLCKRKANYSTLDYRQMVFENGVYHCEIPETNGLSFSERFAYGARNDGADRLVLAAIQQFHSLGLRVTEGKSSPEYLVKRMKSAILCQDYSEQEITKSMMRLILSGRIIQAPVGQYSNRAPKLGLVPACAIGIAAQRPAQT